MPSNLLMDRYVQAIPEFEANRPFLQIERCEERLLFLTGTRALQYARFYAHLGGIAGVCLGLALLRVTPLGGLLAALSALAFFLLPGRFHAVRLLEIDTGQGQLLGEGDALSCPQIRAIRGVYTTQGYDPFSLFAATLDNGKELAFLTLRGTDDILAEALCRTLGLLLDCPAAYVGPFEDAKTCFTPDAPNRAKAAP